MSEFAYIQGEAGKKPTKTKNCQFQFNVLGKNQYLLYGKETKTEMRRNNRIRLVYEKRREKKPEKHSSVWHLIKYILKLLKEQLN